MVFYLKFWPRNSNSAGFGLLCPPPRMGLQPATPFSSRPAGPPPLGLLKNPWLLGFLFWVPPPWALAPPADMQIWLALGLVAKLVFGLTLPSIFRLLAYLSLARQYFHHANFSPNVLPSFSFTRGPIVAQAKAPGVCCLTHGLGHAIHFREKEHLGLQL